ncbi:hypothetical protein F511_10843 [Dorcoceras hygrometricum]|uniref:Uncharacterized protein n=1 Tax=Dorcoceras hygrometricum TaxID=472368 RepID=A0A2Z7BFA1_9LAMI|nr:hypothetical protein F511_10843 [Dorcoceras hygrometricum]
MRAMHEERYNALSGLMDNSTARNTTYTETNQQKEETKLAGTSQQPEVQGSQNNSPAGSANNSSHGACESVVAIHSSQHAVPEAKIQQLNPLCPTHESVVAIHSSHSGNHPTAGRRGAWWLPLVLN